MRTITVELEGRWRANVRGPQSWELCKQAGRRRPHWSRASRSWVVSEKTARDVVAMAEAAGLNVVITGPRMATAAAQERAFSEEHAASAEEAGLW
jgi:hypothetical protein